MKTMDYVEALRIAATNAPQRHRARLQAHAELLESCPPDKRPNVVHALAALHPEYPWPGIPLTSAYPNAPYSYQARIILGESPAKATGLTASEAHRYLSDPISHKWTPAQWLVAEHKYDCLPRDVAVARWVIAAMADPPRRKALLRERVERGPGGATIRGAYWTRIDELTAKDLRPSIDSTFRAAAERLWKATERLLARDHEPLCAVPMWWRTYHRARLLTRASELIIEGREMGHCVGQYALCVKQGLSVIVAMNVSGYRSTVEFSHKGDLLLHKGPHNEKPHALCERALRVLISRIDRAEFMRMALKENATAP